MVRGDIEDYVARHPGPEDVALVVEVTRGATAIQDHALVPTYGAAGIPANWIVNLAFHQVEVYTDPDPAGGYRSRTDYRPGQDVPVEIAGQVVGQIAVADLLWTALKTLEDL